MYYSEEHCYKCNMVTGHSNGKCGQCAMKAEKEAYNKSLREFLYKTDGDKFRDLHDRLYALENRGITVLDR